MQLEIVVREVAFLKNAERIEEINAGTKSRIKLKVKSKINKQY